MTRETSLRAYHEVKARGLLSRRRFQVYEVLVMQGSCTAGEVYSFLAPQGIMQGSISPRFAELQNRGVIEELGVRECRITGKTCIEWGVTDSLPRPVAKRRTKDDKKAEAIEILGTLKPLVPFLYRAKVDELKNLIFKI